MAVNVSNLGLQTYLFLNNPICYFVKHISILITQ